MNAPFPADDTLERGLYAMRIGPIFPITPNAKTKPLISGWPALVKNDRAQIESWSIQYPRCNWGIHCVGLGVIDRDDRKGGAQSFAQLDGLLGFPATLTVRTPGGGVHAYYKLPAGHPGVPNSVETLGRGLDVRSTGGYTLGPRSVTTAGEYTVEHDLPMADAPQWLVDKLGTASQKKSTTPSSQIPDAPAEVLERAQEWLRTAERSIKGAGGDQTAYRVACQLRDVGLSELQAGELMRSEAWDYGCGWRDGWLEAKPIHSAYKYAQNEPGVKSIPASAFTAQPAQNDPLSIVKSPQIVVKRSPLDWAELARKDVPPREWAIDNWLGFNPTLCAGKGGIGKSLLAQQVASALAIGRSYIDNVKKPYTVLMWACEDDHDELWRRQTAIATHFGVPLGAFKSRLIVEPRQGFDNTLLAPAYGKLEFTPLMKELTAQVCDYKADVVIVDNTGQTFGGNENERHPVTTYMNALAGLGQGRPIAAIALAHPARAKGSEFAGNAAWENAARMRWYLGDTLPDVKDNGEEREPDPLVRYLAKRKMNYSTADWRRLTYSAAGIFAVDAPPTMQQRVDRAEAAGEAVLSGIRRLAEMGEHCTASTASPGYLPKLLAKYDLAEGCTVGELDQAMRLAMTTGRVKKTEVGNYSNRTKKFGLAIVDSAP